MGERKRWLYVIVGIFVCANGIIAFAGWLTIQFQGQSGMTDRIENPTTAERGPFLKNETFVAPLYEHIPRSVDPLNPPNDAVEQVISLIYEPLAMKQDDGTLSGVLADSWTLTEDKRELSVQLRKNVHWHDGKPLTAADVHFTYAQSEHKKRFGLERMSSEPDNRQINFLFTEPLTDLTGFLSLPIVPQHAYHPSAEKDHRLIGTGPYQLEQRTEQNTITLRPYEKYWDNTIQLFRQITLQSVTAEEAVDQFIEGKLNLLPQIDPVTAQDVLEQHSDRDSYVNPIRHRGQVYHYLLFNRAKPLWNNAQLRYAIGTVIDKDRLIEEALYGYGTVLDTPRGTVVDGFNEENDDIKKILRNKLDKQKITLHYSSKWIHRDKIAQAIRQMWREAGITVELVKHDDMKQVLKALKTGEADVALLAELVQHDARHLHRWWKESPLKNWRNWSGHQLEEQLTEIVRTENAASRTALLHEWDKRFNKEAPFIPLIVPDTLYFTSLNASDMTEYPNSDDRLYVRAWAVR